jgi:hypothetical protein
VLTPLTADAIADAAVGSPLPEALTPFRAGRFAGVALAGSARNGQPLDRQGARG